MTSFSILIPVYNCEKYIRQCLDSAVLQDYPSDSFEVVLADDGSTDNCGKICDEYAEKYSNVRVFHKENEGLFKTRAFTIRNAKNDYYVFLDADDYLERDALKILAKTVEAEECDAVVFGMQRVYDGKILSTLTEPSFSVITDRRQLLKKCLCNSGYNSIARKCVHKSLYEDMSYTEKGGVAFGEDLLHSMNAFKYAKKMAFIPEVIYNYTLNPDSITETDKTAQFESCFFAKGISLGVLEELDIFTEEDYRDFHAATVVYLASAVAEITSSKMSDKEKKEYFEKLSSHPFFVKYLKDVPPPASVPKKRQFIYKLFMKERYGLLCLIGKVF